MNEVKKVHLGRQVFVISVGAHTKLKVYLRDIEAESASKSVAEEVELRMAELLAERGIRDETVVLEKDIEYLQTQLGSPSDFKEDSSEHEAVEPQLSGTKRLYRDPSRGYLAGIAVGLADYFGIDVVIVRVVLLALLFASGFGLFLYVILWLLVPVAKTQSDRLQMQGKPVTIESLTHMVKNPEVADKTRKVARLTRDFVAKVVKLGVLFTGVALLIGSLLGLVASVAMTSMIISHGIYIEQVKVFPLTGSEIALAIASAVTVGLVLLLLAGIGGMMTVRRKLVPAWVMALLVGLIVISTAVSSGIAASNVTIFQSRYDSLRFSSPRSVPDFKALSVRNADISVSYETSPTHSVEIQTIGFKDFQLIKTDVVNGELVIDAQALDTRTDCVTLCNKLPINVIVRSPALERAQVDGRVNFELKSLAAEKSFELVASNTQSNVQIGGIHAEHYWFNIADPSVMRVVMSNVSTAGPDSRLDMTSSTVRALLSSATSIDAGEGCEVGNPRVFLDTYPPSLTVNGVVFASDGMMQDHVEARNGQQSKTPWNCINIGIFSPND